MDSKNGYRNAIWIAWEKQRRSIVLAETFGAELCIFEGKGNRLVKYWRPILDTVRTISNIKPEVLFVQNPSIFLAWLAIILRPLFGYYLVVDRHTNFKLSKRKSYNPKWLTFHCLSKFTLKKADLTIVTNKYLKHLVNGVGGNAVILPDKIPDFSNSDITRLELKPKSALFICTYAVDEPYEMLFDAISSHGEVNLYVTGKVPVELLKKHFSERIHLLGYVSDEEYLNYLHSVDFVIVLTNQEFTLNCGAYEAIAAGKPMILANTKTIQAYFDKGAVYADCFDKQSLVDSLNEIEDRLAQLTLDVQYNRDIWDSNWDLQFRGVVSMTE